MAMHSSVLVWRIPGTGGAWWAAIYGVAQSRTRLKRLSSNSSSSRTESKLEVASVRSLRRQWQPTPIILPGKFHGWRSLAGSVHGVAKSRARLTSLSLFTFMHWRRKWQPTPLGSCLENPRDGGAWWAAVYGVAQSGTRLKRLSSSRSEADRKR